MSNDQLKLNNKKSGIVTLLGVLLIGGVGTVVSLSLLLQGMASSQTGYTIEQMHQANALVNACSEEALERVREEMPFSGSDEVILNTGKCEYTVVNNGGDNRTVTATSTVESMSRKIIITLDKIDPQINVTSWLEVNDF